MKKSIRTVYVADCGCVFTTREECESHEGKFESDIYQARKSIVNSLNIMTQCLLSISGEFEDLENKHPDFNVEDLFPMFAFDKYPFELDYMDEVDKINEWRNALLDLMDEYRGKF